MRNTKSIFVSVFGATLNLLTLRKLLETKSSRSEIFAYWVGSLLLTLASGSIAMAEVVQTNESNPSEVYFAASTSDLMNAGASTLVGVAHNGYTPYNGSSTANLNDGSTGTASVLNTAAFDLDGVWTSTYTLNTTLNPNGYDITSVQTISGWAAPRRNQSYELLVRTVGASVFTSLGTFSYTPGGNGGARITLTDSTGKLAGNVAEVQFKIASPGAGAETVYREFDVISSASTNPINPPPPPLQIAPNDPRIGYSDYARLVTLNGTTAQFDRILAGAQGSLQNANPAARVRFRTDATSIVALLSTGSLGATQGTGVVLVDGTRTDTFDAGGNNSTLTVNVLVSGSGYHNVELLLPYSQSVQFTGLTLNGEATFQTMPDRPSTRWIAYGDSITEGFSASDSAKNYPSLVAAAKSWQVVNMGFGWRGLKASGASGSDGTAISSLNPSVVTVLMGYNDASAGLSATEYRTDLEALVGKIRQSAPTVPIYLISPIFSINNQTLLGAYRSQIEDLATHTSDANLYWIDGLALGINAGNSATYLSDGIHPTDAGFALIAQNLAPQLPATPSQKVTFNSAATVPITTTAFTIMGSALNVMLNFAPTAGAMTVINNTGTNGINGRFTNLPDGGTINADYNGVTYSFTANYEGGDGNDLTLSLIKPFTQWEAQPGLFSPAQMADTTVSGPLVIPQNDGYANLLKYLFNINPAQPMTSTDRAALPVAVIDTTTSPGTPYLTLTYRQNSLLTGITLAVQTSPDLKTWTTVSPDLSQQVGKDASTRDPIMEVGVKTNGVPKLFIRLNLTMP
ncbi:MAG: GDSL-type esterase/lipase family protein [Verrucomicrobia bacterium]|nr:GDSL-type esterase/lipase family protein [Verrucomicrobiota bacterium]